MKLHKISLAAPLLLMLLAGCSVTANTPTPAPAPITALAPTQTPGGSIFQVVSEAFADGENIPRKYTCDGESVSPDLKWSGAPTNTQSFALIVDDPDAASGNFTHWVAFDIPASQTEIAEGARVVGKAGNNGTGKSGYTGPCPPSGTHHYYFQIYALDVPSLNLGEGATRDQVKNTMQTHILGQGTLVGKYSK